MVGEWDFVADEPYKATADTGGEPVSDEPLAKLRSTEWEPVFDAPDPNTEKQRYETDVSNKVFALKSNPSTAYLPDVAIESIAKSRARKPGVTQGGVGDFVKDVCTILSTLPLQTKSTFEAAVLGNDPEAIARSETQRAVRAADAKRALDPEREYVMGLTSSDLKSGITSIAFSLASMGAYLVASLPVRAAAMAAGPVVGPVAGQVLSHGAGMAASAKAGYNMDVGQVLNQLYGRANDEFKKTSGRDMTPEEFGKVVDHPDNHGAA